MQIEQQQQQNLVGGLKIELKYRVSLMHNITLNNQIEVGKINFQHFDLYLGGLITKEHSNALEIIFKMEFSREKKKEV